MKKFIAILICVCFMGLGGYYGSSYFHHAQFKQKEEAAMSVMNGLFATFVKKWDVSLVPSLFVDGAELQNISNMLTQIKGDLGNCTMDAVTSCEAAARHPRGETDYSMVGREAVACSFELTCDNNKAQGQSILFIEGQSVKVYRFSLDVDE